MKKLSVVISFIILIGINISLSRSSRQLLDINFEQQNIAHANEVSYSWCYTSFNIAYDCSYVKCNSPCCWYKDHIPTHEIAGECSQPVQSNCGE